MIDLRFCVCLSLPRNSYEISKLCRYTAGSLAIILDFLSATYQFALPGLVAK